MEGEDSTEKQNTKHLPPTSSISFFVGGVVLDDRAWTWVRMSNENVFRDSAARFIGIAEITYAMASYT